jgi:cytochrome c
MKRLVKSLVKLSCTVVLAGLVLSLAARAPAIFAGDEPATSGDPVRGEALYTRECAGCHAVNETLVGPKHCGLYGRRAGTVPGYPYSDVMKQAGFIWDAKHLDEFLQSPITYLNGTNMGYAGLDSAKDRADIIAYLHQAMNPALCAQTASKLAKTVPKLPAGG